MPQLELFALSVSLLANDSSSGRMYYTFVPRFLAIFPKQIVVFVLIPGCSSLEVFARHFNRSPLIIRSDTFVMIVRTDLTVCSRTSGAKSVNPVACCDQHASIMISSLEVLTSWGKILSVTTF